MQNSEAKTQRKLQIIHNLREIEKSISSLLLEVVVQTLKKANAPREERMEVINEFTTRLEALKQTFDELRAEYETLNLMDELGFAISPN